MQRFETQKPVAGLRNKAWFDKKKKRLVNLDSPIFDRSR